ncbi:MAG: aldo/keto reductase [Alphaproteobacteria bacterium]|nr:aldo/keto reductase [Alphaproteobacteria bacterium]
MKYRKLGVTGLQVSEIGLGCSGFWGDRLFSDDKAIRVACEAFERGVNLFDTGHNYSNYNAEPRLGRALKKILAGTDRSRIVVSTKAGTLTGAALRFPLSQRKGTNYSPNYIESACSQSIRNLQCGYLDIFQLHAIRPDDLTDELLTRLAAMKKNGMYRYLGINTHRESDMAFVSQHPEIFDVALVDFNVLQLDRIKIIDRLAAAGIGVMAGTVLGQSHLFKGKIGRFRSLADIWYFARAAAKPDARRLAKCAKAMQPVLSAVSEMTPPQAAVAFVLEHPVVATCVVGTTKIANLLELIETTDKRLSDESKTAIRRAFESQAMRLSK